MKWEPLKEQPVTERALFADPEKKSLFSAAAKVQHLTPAIGTEITGIDLRQLSDKQKDELYVKCLLILGLFRIFASSALLVAERGVVCKFLCATMLQLVDSFQSSGTKRLVFTNS